MGNKNLSIGASGQVFITILFCIIFWCVSILVILYIFRGCIWAGEGITKTFQEKANKTVCEENMKKITVALNMYSQKHNNQFPDKNGAAGLEMLMAEGYLKNPKTYICPSRNTAPANDGKSLTEINVDYIYVGGYNASTPPQTCILWEKEDIHKKQGNVLFCDGHIELRKTK